MNTLEKRGKILLYMSLSAFMGYLPWYNFSAVVNYVSSEMDLKPSDIGLILSSFQIGYVVVVVLTGWLADKVGPKKVMTSAALLAGIFSSLFAILGNDLTSILVLRVLTGAACGSIYVPGLALLSQWFGEKERAHAMGAYTAALIAAFAGGYFVASPLAGIYGWRVGVVATSLPAFLAFLLSYRFVEERENGLGIDNGRDVSRGKQQSATNLASVFAVALIVLSYMGHMWELFCFYGWLGPFLDSSFSASGMDMKSASTIGGTLSALVVLMGVPSSYVGGLAADRYGPVKAIIVSSVLSASFEPIFGLLHGKEIWIVTSVGAWIGFWIVADTAIYKSLLTMVIPSTRTGVLLGIQSAAGFGVTIVSPLVFGSLLTSYNGPIPVMEAHIWWPSFLSLGIGSSIAPLCALAFHWICKKGKITSVMSYTMEARVKGSSSI